ncbi:MAG TPA: hypothetical protein VN767_30060 [Streptosporangiaceae bacterium]|jgi:Ca2+/Na+ antiporter|nr:hypothetical protein [Streptosporangiaceae bacterium]
MTDFPPGGSDQPPNPGFAEPFAFGPAGPARRPRRPGWIWFVLALAVLVAGIAWLIYGLTSVAGTIDDLQRVPVPGHGTISLTHSGGYTIYYEGVGARNGDIANFHVNVAPASSGAAVASLTHYGAIVTYNIGSHEGRAVLSLRLKSPGRFTVTTTGAARPNSDIAIGGSIGSGIVGALLPSIPLIIIGFGGSLALLIIRIVSARSGRRRYA